MVTKGLFEHFSTTRETVTPTVIFEPQKASKGNYTICGSLSLVLCLLGLSHSVIAKKCFESIQLLTEAEFVLLSTDAEKEDSVISCATMH